MHIFRPLSFLCLLFLCTTQTAIQTSALANTNFHSWAEGQCSLGTYHGANRQYYNAGAYFKWRNHLGDWRDTENVAQGDTPFTSSLIEDLDEQQEIQMDVSNIVVDWHQGKYFNQGFFIRNRLSGKANIVSKENTSGLPASQLEVVTSQGTFLFKVNADTELKSTTYKCSGEEELLSSGSSILLYFSLDDISHSATIHSAKLILNIDDKQYGDSMLDTYRVAITSKNYDDSDLSWYYPNDYQMIQHADVLLAESFEHDNWQSNWSVITHQENLQIVTANPSEKFEPFMGKALQVEITENELTGLNLLYLFADELGNDLEEVYLRYYIRLGNTWHTDDDGKLPGIAGTYAGTDYEGGWGGRRSDGSNGWSARGRFNMKIKGNNPFSDMVPIGNYIYHADQVDNYGDHIIYDGQAPGMLTPNKWYAIEQYVKVNTPGKNDGVIKAWINGVAAYTKDDLQFRDEHSAHIKIDRVWMNIFHGGKTPISKTTHAYLDNVVIAKSYIGPTRLSNISPLAGAEPNLPPEIHSYTPEQSSMFVDFGEVVNFSVDVSDPEGANIAYQWLLNGEVVAENSLTYSFQMPFLTTDNSIVELIVIDDQGVESRLAWQLQSQASTRVDFAVKKDTYLADSTYKAQGFKETIKLATNTTGLFNFSFEGQQIDYASLTNAYLILSDLSQYGELNLAVFLGTDDWSEGSGDLSGATRDHKDYQSQLPWQNRLGDWVDASGQLNGSHPFSLSVVEDTNEVKQVAINITQLLDSEQPANEINIVLKALSGKHNFASKEAIDQVKQPKLSLFFQ